VIPCPRLVGAVGLRLPTRSTVLQPLIDIFIKSAIARAPYGLTEADVRACRASRNAERGAFFQRYLLERVDDRVQPSLDRRSEADDAL
jgi:hypothetical protein